VRRVVDGFRIERIEWDKGQMEKALLWSPEIAALLKAVADERIGRASYPNATFRVRAGVGKRRGAFAQGIMYHPRARFVEFGTRKVPPRAVMRRAFGLV
jgi:hypothetical protein